MTRRTKEADMNKKLFILMGLVMLLLISAFTTYLPNIRSGKAYDWTLIYRMAIFDNAVGIFSGVKPGECYDVFYRKEPNEETKELYLYTWSQKRAGCNEPSDPPMDVSVPPEGYGIPFELVVVLTPYYYDQYSLRINFYCERPIWSCPHD